MDFDRCNGILSNFRIIHQIGPVGAGGLAVSPSGQYLYTSGGGRLYQYNLWSADIEGSRQLIATYDGFKSPFATGFYQGHLAPDGKIYFSTGSTNNVMHIIHYPDRPGPACGVEQHGLLLPALMGFSAPNFANYRLGPLDGSACDTLGLDNLPQAWWLPEADTADARSVFFRDLSYFEPSHWSWDFGDGSPASTEPSPDHSFSGPGLYTVCLTVSNANGTDTHCETLRIGLTAQENPDWAARFEIWPNPFDAQLQILLSPGLPSPVLRLYDATGRLLRSERLTPGVQDIDSAAWPPGFYVWELSARGERVKTGKLVK
ncbi:MAG: PKD domain-containing protein [Saprospiraceae bacterium]|nr:PKD domain-containing protein [Saprospiraceae bacterium]